MITKRANGAGGKQCDMDKRSTAESRDVGTSSQKLGQPSDLQLLQKMFDRMK
ncbi:MAG TPA: hypothetical protein VK993_12320 [Chthoniobacterales bacterium]|nr:hypothetical protein [Chthoniobacterales bacterium]